MCQAEHQGKKLNTKAKGVNGTNICLHARNIQNTAVVNPGRGCINQIALTTDAHWMVVTLSGRGFQILITRCEKNGH